MKQCQRNNLIKNGLYEVTMKVPVLVISWTFYAILVARLRGYFQKEVHTWGSSSVLDTKSGVLVMPSFEIHIFRDITRYSLFPFPPLLNRRVRLFLLIRKQTLKPRYSQAVYRWALNLILWMYWLLLNNVGWFIF